MLVKMYRGPEARAAPGRYSPAECIGASKTEIYGNPDQGAHQHVLYRAPEPHHAHVNAPLYAVDQCVLQEMGKPLPFAGAVFRLVQLDAEAQDARHHARDRGWPHR